MQNDRPVREAVSDLNAMGVEYAFVHEAACVLFGVSFYASVLKIDVLAPPASFRKLVRRLPRRNGFERSLPGGRTVRARSHSKTLLTPGFTVHEPPSGVTKHVPCWSTLRRYRQCARREWRYPHRRWPGQRSQRRRHHFRRQRLHHAKQRCRSYRCSHKRQVQQHHHDQRWQERLPCASEGAAYRKGPIGAA
jgi:hypothetical protein